MVQIVRCDLVGKERRRLLDTVNAALDDQRSRRSPGKWKPEQLGKLCDAISQGLGGKDLHVVAGIDYIVNLRPGAGSVVALRDVVSGRASQEGVKILVYRSAPAASPARVPLPPLDAAAQGEQVTVPTTTAAAAVATAVTAPVEYAKGSDVTVEVVESEGADDGVVGVALTSLQGELPEQGPGMQPAGTPGSEADMQAWAAVMRGALTAAYGSNWHVVVDTLPFAARVTAEHQRKVIVRRGAATFLAWQHAAVRRNPLTTLLSAAWDVLNLRVLRRVVLIALVGAFLLEANYCPDKNALAERLCPVAVSLKPLSVCAAFAFVIYTLGAKRMHALLQLRVQKDHQVGTNGAQSGGRVAQKRRKSRTR